MDLACYPPVFIDKVLDDPGAVRRLVEDNAPYSPVQRYFAGDAEFRSSAGKASSNQRVFIAPVFRCLLYTSPSPRDRQQTRMPSSA